ncbi:hypothetical protein [Vasconcelosia minhoensis]|uniref:hypothetical protein n=1 Tax=Vasconcelosia minhoensis TaxID=3366354 RepID=UPI001D14680D|nr:hypothetical protein [Romeria gracilis]
MARKKGNQVFSIVFAVTWGVITGVLWAYANPIQLVPGVIQWRSFAFLPPVIGILFGPISGFISGYLGSVVWGLLLRALPDREQRRRLKYDSAEGIYEFADPWPTIAFFSSATY